MRKSVVRLMSRTLQEKIEPFTAAIAVNQENMS